MDLKEIIREVKRCDWVKGTALIRYLIPIIVALVAFGLIIVLFDSVSGFVYDRLILAIRQILNMG